MCDIIYIKCFNHCKKRLEKLYQAMSSQLNSKRHALLKNLASMYMFRCDMQKFKPILQPSAILASKLVAYIQKYALYPVVIFTSVIILCY